jgi:hypothetical protein
MPQPNFRILLKDDIHPDPEAMRLCIDAGIDHLGITLQLVNDGSLLGYEFYTFIDRRQNASDLAAALLESPLAAIRTGHVSVVYNTPDTVLVPDEVFQPALAQAFLEVVHGDLMPDTTLLQDHHAGEGIHVLYRIPHWMQQEFGLRFRQASQMHAHTAFLTYMRALDTARTAHTIHLWFYPGKAIALITRDGGLLLLQTIPFDIPEDLSYALLNACERYALEPSDLTVRVAGLLETDSIVFSELQRYFPDVATVPDGVRFARNDFFSSYPAHYFTPAFQLCSCGS